MYTANNALDSVELVQNEFRYVHIDTANITEFPIDELSTECTDHTAFIMYEGFNVNSFTNVFVLEFTVYKVEHSYNDEIKRNISRSVWSGRQCQTSTDKKSRRFLQYLV